MHLASVIALYRHVLARQSMRFIMVKFRFCDALKEDEMSNEVVQPLPLQYAYFYLTVRVERTLALFNHPSTCALYLPPDARLITAI
jgi:hypothetical protein